MSSSVDSRGSSALMPDVVLIGYRHGYFPMADPETSRIMWHRPDPRAVIPLDGVHLSRSLRQVLRRRPFTVTANVCFDAVIHACARHRDSWISPDIVRTYVDLHTMGHAHSVETWQDGNLVGGLYGVQIGGAFFGESMFSTVSNASKVAFAHLVGSLIVQGFRLLDTQYINDHTRSLGAVEWPDSHYQQVLATAVGMDCSFSLTEPS